MKRAEIKEQITRIKKNKNFGMQMFLFVAVLGYVLFFSSTLWMPEGDKWVDATPYYQSRVYQDYTMYLTEWVYSEKDAAMQLIIELHNRGVTDQEFMYQAVERSRMEMKVEAVLVEPSYLVLRITDIPAGWKEISFRISDGSENSIKFYTNVRDVEKRESLPEKSVEGYAIDRLNAQIRYDDVQINDKKKEIQDLKMENEDILKRIEKIQKETYPSKVEAEAAKESAAKAQSQITINEDKIKDLQEEITEISERTENIKNQIKELEKIG